VLPQERDGSRPRIRRSERITRQILIFEEAVGGAATASGVANELVSPPNGPRPDRTSGTTAIKPSAATWSATARIRHIHGISPQPVQRVVGVGDLLAAHAGPSRM
jgi:hypothetical protein